MMRKFWKRAAAVSLTAALCLAPAAQAITPDQFRDLLEEYYIGDIPPAVYEAETVEEIEEALGDPYTMYLSPEDYQTLLDSMRDTSVVGIGIGAQSDPAGLLVVDVYENSPAAEVGLVPGDIIIRVGDQEAAGQPAEIITSWLKGEEGTEVTFTVRHADGSEEVCTTRRALVLIPATTSELLEDGETGYILCTTFGEDTLDHVADGVLDYQDATLWLIDLRTNGGGDVYDVTQTLGVFLGEGNMVYLRNGEGKVYRYVSNQESLTEAPAIVLTSPYTASAAEIFSLAVKDRQGGLVIGSHTYGKGVAQVIITGTEALADGDAVRITSYQYYGSEGSGAQGIGAVPDLVVTADFADEIAQLLSPQEPEGDKTGWIRFSLGGRMWYVNLAEGPAPYLGELLSALPPSVLVKRGTGDQWTTAPLADLIEEYQVPGYTSRLFSDVKGLACERAADTLRTYQMVKGYEDGTFRAENTLTRAELCSLLVQAMGLRDNGSGTLYTDVAADSWYAPYIRAAERAGYMEGVGGDRFDPQGTVTHEQLFTVLGRLASELNLVYYEAAQEVPAETGVPESYSDWAKPWVWLLEGGHAESVLYGDLTEIDPQAPATRGETIQVLYNILTLTGVLNY